ncbi:serine hydrolase domain-containing protein [Ferruginibacter sp. SUN002]|uniref:serine hydrolase domain-containing protein n=1 Tax=Ferruginibacter sp. SUN002 TaxID=2937789 RepID=UPI003D36E477
MQIDKIQFKINKFSTKNSIKNLQVGVYKDGEIFRLSNSGNISHQAFELASITKVFTGCAIMIAIEENKISLNTTLEQILSNKFEISDSFKSITIEELLTHCSGLPNLPHLFLEKMQTNPTDPYSVLQKDDVFNYLSLQQTLGKKRYCYSNFGYGLLGLILEHIYVFSYADIMTKKIFDPLNMQFSSIGLSSKTENILEQGYSVEGKETTIWQDDVLAGAGSLISTCDDMMLFIKAHFASNSLKNILNTILLPQTKKMAISWHRQGWLGRIAGYKTYLWHNGCTGGYSSYITLSIEKKTAFLILSSKGIIVDELGMDLLHYVS